MVLSSRSSAISLSLSRSICIVLPNSTATSSPAACFRDVSGWEGADWFAAPGQAAELGELSWGRHPNWWGRWAAEHAACRDACVLLDMSFMSKFLVRGRDAGALLDWLATARVDGSAGTITYTQLLSPRGTLEADLTITKLPADCAGVGGLGGEPGFLVVRVRVRAK